MITLDSCYQEIFTTNGYTLTRRIVYCHIPIFNSYPRLLEYDIYEM
ncbi:hypothetical protein PBR_1171 [Segatella baroniae B14]|uniref:Uncharacterized protein n=1 Tax=Segatella baroniae B14 TaxID=752555 RepID=D8DVD7_9BACT|nr:hypothetical protein PBR_1171 [Segatella baroniae B14]